MNILPIPGEKIRFLRQERICQSIDELKEGTIIRNLGSGHAYIITQNWGDHATAVRTVDVSNPSEWEIVE